MFKWRALPLSSRPWTSPASTSGTACSGWPSGRRSTGEGKFRIWRHGDFELAEIDDYHVFQDGIDRALEAAGHPPERLIFASKHRSKDGRKTLTVHHTGNFGEGKFGGRPQELATAAPRIALSLLKSLKASVTSYKVSYEATHHGPSDILVPSVYVEIGSTEVEWRDTGGRRDGRPRHPERAGGPGRRGLRRHRRQPLCAPGDGAGPRGERRLRAHRRRPCDSAA